MKKFLENIKKGGKWIFLKLKKFFSKNFFKALRKVIMLFSRAFSGAILFAFLAELAPELRENLPNFFKFVDFLLAILEELCGEIISHL